MGTTGRAARIGAAAGGAPTGGRGTGSAVAGAYALAGELLADPDDYAGAFRRYQALVQPFAYEGAENGENSGRFLAPRTPWGLAIRDNLMSFPPMKRWMVAEAQKSGTAIALPAYPA